MKKWMQKLDDMMTASDSNIDEMVKESTTAKNEDIGMINDKSGAGILARDNGVIEGFSYYNLGFRMDPKNMTLSFYAPTIQLFTGNFQVIDGDKEFNRITEDYAEILKKIGAKSNGEV